MAPEREGLRAAMGRTQRGGMTSRQEQDGRADRKMAGTAREHGPTQARDDVTPGRRCEEQDGWCGVAWITTAAVSDITRRRITE